MCIRDSREPVPCREARARMNQTDPPVRDLHRDAGPHEDPLSRRDLHVMGDGEVRAGIPGMRVRRQAHLGVQQTDPDPHWLSRHAAPLAVSIAVASFPASWVDTSQYGWGSAGSSTAISTASSAYER